jgi:hypothetical protein
MGPLYPVHWVKRLFGKVSEYLKFQENKNFKEHIENDATFLNNRCAHNSPTVHTDLAV